MAHNQRFLPGERTLAAMRWKIRPDLDRDGSTASVAEAATRSKRRNTDLEVGDNVRRWPKAHTTLGRFA